MLICICQTGSCLTPPPPERGVSQQNIKPLHSPHYSGGRGVTPAPEFGREVKIFSQINQTFINPVNSFFEALFFYCNQSRRGLKPGRSGL
jgi:hypothetical protein